MTKPLLFYNNPKTVRNTLNAAWLAAEEAHLAERRLVHLLYEIDQNRYFTRLGFKSLKGYCIHDLKFTAIQSQRIVTAVRRYEPIAKIGSLNTRAGPPTKASTAGLPFTGPSAENPLGASP